MRARQRRTHLADNNISHHAKSCDSLLPCINFLFAYVFLCSYWSVCDSSCECVSVHLPQEAGLDSDLILEVLQGLRDFYKARTFFFILANMLSVNCSLGFLAFLSTV